jgi:HlyD family secretion protein
MKKFLVLLLLAAAAGGGWWFFKMQKPDAPEYLTDTVAKGDITQIVTATGTLRPVINVTVGCQISGTIQELMVDFNSQVKEGQVIARLDPATYDAIVKQAEGELQNARATLELAELTSSRKAELVKQNAATQAELDTALANLHQAQAGVSIREGALQKARVDLSRCTIYSPIEGTVIARAVDVGQTVAASLSAPNLFTIANDMKNMQITAAVSEADIGTVAEGQNVDFTVDAFPYTSFTGVVEQIRNSPVTVQSVVTYDVLVAVQNPELKLKPGMTANVSIIVAQRKGILRVPNSALRFRPPETAPAAAAAAPAEASSGGGRAKGSKFRGARPERKIHVLKSPEAKPEPVPLKLGISDNLYTEVLGGVDEGATLVTGLKNPAPKPGVKAAPNPLGGPSMRPPR